MTHFISHIYNPESSILASGTLPACFDDITVDVLNPSNLDYAERPISGSEKENADQLCHFYCYADRKCSAYTSFRRRSEVICGLYFFQIDLETDAN